MAKKAVIIGAGVAGMASAIRLKVQGFSDVTVYEQAPSAGGKLREFKLGGYRFDAGPSLFTLPAKVEALFKLAKVPMEPYFRYRKLNEVCRYFFFKPETIDYFIAPAEPEALALAMEAKFGEPAQNVRKYLKTSAFRYKVAGPLFLENSLHEIDTWLSKNALSAYPKMAKLALFNTLNQENEKSFKTPEARQYFNRFATYNGSDPYQTPGLMSMIPHLEQEIGAYLPNGGMIAITEALYQLGLDLGVKYVFNTSVEKINYSKGKVTGVSIVTNTDKQAKSSKEVLADVVVCNMDVTPAYRKLLPDLPAPEKILTQPRSSSALIFYWGVKKIFPQLGLHNILFTKNYPAEFKAIFEQKALYHDPTIYINITSKYEQADAPEGCENWFVMINAPQNDGQDWNALIADIRERIQLKIEEALGLQVGALAQLIECEEILDPRSIESRTSSYLGSLYGTSSNNRMSAFWRHPNRAFKVKNLYFAGGSVHPGGGIPLALSSAEIVAKLIEKDNN